jgi:hypothetical protein
MGFLDDLFGGSSKPRVTEKEYKKAKSDMFVGGFSQRERAKVDEIFAPDFNMKGTDAHPRGLEKAEIEARIKWMRENKSKHGLSDNRIDEIKSSLTKRI